MFTQIIILTNSFWKNIFICEVLYAQHLIKRNSDISSFKFKQGKIKRQPIKRWLKLTDFQHNLFKLLTMKVLCHYNSCFWIFPRVLHIQTNQLQKYHYSKIHFSGLTYGALTSRTEDRGRHGWQEEKPITSTIQILNLNIFYKERGSVKSMITFK